MRETCYAKTTSNHKTKVSLDRAYLEVKRIIKVQFLRSSVMATKTLFSGAIVQIQNNIASMFHTLTQKSCRAEVESVGGFQPKNVSNNLNVKLLLIQNVDNVILGDVTMDLQLVQQTLVELTFQVWVGSTIVYFKLNITNFGSFSK